jgi:light-harvesting complex I chlorophyll a/b binding protein 1
MAVEDLVGGINDPIFGGTPEGKIFDPLGLGADEASLYRRRCVEIKHGRVCMVAFLGMTVGPNDLFTPSHALLSPSLDLHFDDIPGGIAAIDAVPAAGWLQIFALVGVHELTVAKQDYTKTPGEIPTFLGFKPDDAATFKEKQLKELKNGRLAMIAVLGEMMAQKVSGMGTYEQLGAMGESLGIELPF